MTIWQPELAKYRGPRYQAIAEAIGASIRSGELGPGVKLPPQRDLAWRLGVTVGTVTRGYMLAEQRGLVSGEVGRGTFVRQPRSGVQPILHAPSGDTLDLSRNAPAIGEPTRLLADALTELSQREGLEKLLAYAPTAGYAEHRAAGARWMGRVGLNVRPEQVVLTAGAQQGVAAALAALAEPGDRILTEQLTYCGLIDAARLLRLRPEGLPLDEEGIRPDAVEAACRAGRVRVLCVTPTNQNPTNATMSLSRREEIAALARRLDLIVVEDDVYGYLVEQRPPPIAALAPERTVYIASASKCIVPGLRVAWLAGPEALVPGLIDAVHALCVSVAALPAQIVSQWIEDGTADQLTRRHREEIARRQAIAAEVFAGFEMRHAPTSFNIFPTLPEPWRAQEFVEGARAKGIVIVPAGTFAVGRAEAPHAVRISLSAAPDTSTLKSALVTLADMARAGPGARRAVI
ncbi:MAG TPA: PLP-dependent aminotransferase family protein [Candidatus Cybelea sp.]|nr:PLP-dependent aminotransferase family protein [Candidatus Cybelea sp.]